MKKVNLKSNNTKLAMPRSVFTIFFGMCILVLVFSFTFINHAFASATVSATPNTILATLSNGLVGYWPFDGRDTVWTSSSAATTLDESGNGNTGTLSSMTRAGSPVQGKIGQALTFSSALGSHVNVTSASSLQGFSQMSICAWGKLNNYDGIDGSMIAAKPVANQGASPQDPFTLWGVSVNTAGKIVFQVSTGAVSSRVFTTSATTFPLNTWTHVCSTYNGSIMKTYINGVQDANTSATSLAIGTNTQPVDIGALLYTGFNDYWNGRLDDVRVYNRALSAAEVKQLYNQTANVTTSSATPASNLASGLLGYWTFDGRDSTWAANGTSGTTTDRSIKNNTATFSGISATSSVKVGKVGQAFSSLGAAKIDLNNSGFQSQTFTVAGWVKLSTNQTGTAFITDTGSSATGWRFGINSSLTNKPSCYSDNGAGNTLNSSTLLSGSNSTWYHLACVYDGQSKYIYINGAVDSSASTTGTITYTSDVASIGYQRFDNTQGFSGALDDWHVYNRALTSAEISQLYNGLPTTVASQASSTNISASSLSNGLIGWWSMDGRDINWTANTIADKSTSVKNGTLVGMTKTSGPAQGKIGQALSFNGTNQYISTSLSQTTNTFTWSAWLKPSTTTNMVVFLDDDGSFHGHSLSLTGGVTPRIHNCKPSTCNDVTASGSLTFGQWNHLVVTANAGAVTFYINGVNSGTATIDNNGNTFSIGQVALGDYAYYRGLMDDVRVYNRALSPSEVNQLYFAGK